MLRFVMPPALSGMTGALILGLSTAVSAQTAPIDADLEADVLHALKAAKQTGLSLRERINILSETYTFSDRIAGAGVASLSNKRARSALGVRETSDGQTGAGDERYPHGVYVFASFSMPAPALRQLLDDAARLGVPVVFNGFLNSSAIETEAVLRKLYRDASASNGFVIDPTLFTRFGITVVPSFVTTQMELDVCDTRGCAGDMRPAHDIVKGNIPLETALRIIATGQGDAPAPALAALKERL